MRHPRPTVLLAFGFLLAGAAASADTFTVVNTNDSGPGTLHQAILDANTNPGADLIAFDIPGGGVQTITLTSPLPVITDPVTIDGYTQPGSAPNTNGPGLGLNTELTIEIDGWDAGEHGCLALATSDSVVKGLDVYYCHDEGIRLPAGPFSGNRIEGCFIGTQTLGVNSWWNGIGILIEGQSNATIGGTSPAAKNLIAANHTQILIGDSANSGHVIQGNFIGVQRSGTKAVYGYGSQVGVLVRVGTDILIGGDTPATRNVISVGGPGIALGDAFGESLASGNTVTGNFLGTDVTGTQSLGIGVEGIRVASQNNTIGGTAPGSGNIIADAQWGIWIDSGHGTVVRGNSIGTDPSGTLDLGNREGGIRVDANDVTIGGTGPGEANVIAFNGDNTGGGAGVLVLGQRVTVRGNRIFENKQHGTLGGLGIDLFDGVQGPTLNDAGDGDIGPNGLQNFPVITSSTASGASGTLNSKPNASFTIDFYATPGCDGSGFGEGNAYLGSKSVMTDGTGNAAFTRALTVPPGNIVTATATDAAGNTSEFSQCASLAPSWALVDHGSHGGNDNLVLEPGETASIEPFWTNLTGAPLTATGTVSDLTGPPGATYTIVDDRAAYALDPHETWYCDGDGYEISVSSPAIRPARHWDIHLTEMLDAFLASPKTWTIHVGDSFRDVPRSQLFYRKIETAYHGAMTVGCDTDRYCPDDKVTRAQLSIFVARGIAGLGSAIPSNGTWNGAAYDCEAGGISLFTDVLPTDIFCKHVHFLAVQNVTMGCDAGRFCPEVEASRLEMAALVAKAMVAPLGEAGVPLTYGPDPVSGDSYSCDPASPGRTFFDVPASDPFCKFVHYLRARRVIAGCGGNLYCATSDVKRDEMAKFLSNAFALELGD
jgi:hypothetical protein